MKIETEEKNLYVSINGNAQIAYNYCYYYVYPFFLATHSFVMMTINVFAVYDNDYYYFEILPSRQGA